MTEDLVTLKSIIEIANLHADRMQIAFSYLEGNIPVTEAFMANLSHQNLSALDLLTGRFAKLQDLIGSKIFPFILNELKENIDGLSSRDRLHLLEKLELIPSAQIWFDARTSRNKIAHEYPDPKLMAQNINVIIDHAIWLLNYWFWLRQEIDTRVFAQYNELTK